MYQVGFVRSSRDIFFVYVKVTDGVEVVSLEDIYRMKNLLKLRNRSAFWIRKSVFHFFGEHF